MTQKETLARCIGWYVAALVLAPLPYIAFGERELVSWCVICLPSLLGAIFFMHGGPDPTPIIVMGYLVQIGLAAKAVTGREQTTRRICYLIFRCLLVADVLVAWLGPIVFLLLMRPGE